MGSGNMQGLIRRAAVAGIVATAGTAMAADTVYVGPAGGTWDADANWAQSGADLTYFTGDDVMVQPGAADAAVIRDGTTVNLSSTESVSDVQVSHPSHASDTSATHGTARLNIGSGAVLTTSVNTGIRVGRALDAGQALGTSRGEIVQTSGAVYVAAGQNGLRLSQADSGPVADSYYEISGGLVRGGSAPSGAIVSDLRIGLITNTWGTAEFHVNGSAATAIDFLDVHMAGSTAGSGTSVLHFSVDANGVTPITVADEFQFRSNGTTFGQNLLDIDLVGEAPSTVGSSIRLVTADRLNTNGITNDPLLERFTGMPEGTTIVRQFGGFEYTWTLDYNDGSDDGALDAFVELDFVSKTVIPEPAGLALLGVAGLALARRRRA